MSAEPCIVHLWCGPRTLSTATMYSFSQRQDCTVVDEPLYAAYLKKYPHYFRPYRDELMKAQNTDGDSVIAAMHSATGKKVIVAKHMAKHIESIADRRALWGNSSVRAVKHVIIVRDPFDMIISWTAKNGVHREGCTLDATSLPHMVHLYSEIRSATGTSPIVVDSSLLKIRPKEVLAELCRRLEIPFFEEQLSWPIGPKPDIDGLWAPHWYQEVHSSDGFAQNTSSKEPGDVQPTFHSLNAEQLNVYREAVPFYDLLRRHAIGVDPLCPGSSVPPFYIPPPPSTVTQNTAASGPGETSQPVNSLEQKQEEQEKDETVIDHGLKIHMGSGPGALSDPRNADLLAWVGDRLLPREQAKVSVFDSAVQGGDAVWEGLRVYDGRVFKLEEHLQRLADSAKAMDFKHVPTTEYIRRAVFRTLAANAMRDDAHIRLTLTRGAKITSSMNPAFNIFGTNLIILPEWKPVGNAATYDNSSGIKLITAANRRNGPQCVDSKIHHCNLINNILPKIQANYAQAADALMLDSEGFVSETNATNVFIVKHGIVHTPHADYCLPGITRSVIMSLVPTVLGTSCVERRISLAEFHAADEVFTTGTMGELTPVREIDGRLIGPDGTGQPGPVIRRLQEAYKDLTNREGVPLPPFTTADY